MTQNDTVIEGQIVDNDEPKKTSRLALLRSDTAYAIYGAGAILLVGAAAAAIFKRSSDSIDTPETVTVAPDPIETTN